MRTGRVDVVVLGGGFAGLAAARGLRRAGLETLVIEARDRLGGRAHTVHDGRTPVPVELGASFVHEGGEATLALARAHGLALEELDGPRFVERTRGRVVRDDDFDRTIAGALDRVFHVRGLRARGDLPVADAIEAADLAPEARVLAQTFVEGFHAVDPRAASTHALAQGGAEGPGRMLFFADGYGALVDRLARDLLPDVRLGHEVVELAVRPREVVVHTIGPSGREHEHRARAAVVALPLGVVRDGPLRFDPVLEADRVAALEHLAMGDVVKVTLVFREPFWVERRPDLRRAALVQAPGRAFPTFWTSRPRLAPVLVAWAGGPAARALVGRTREELAGIATDDLAAIVGVRAPFAHDRLAHAFVHDWSTDRFARGAYSYVRVGGASAIDRAARPLAPHVVFAGEHTMAPPRDATVEGAIESGERAARRIAARLGRAKLAA